jgi:hypothetical protein
MVDAALKIESRALVGEVSCLEECFSRFCARRLACQGPADRLQEAISALR